jgi:cell division transport system permease protein
MSTTKRIFGNTWKQIERSGWIAWSSIAVMAVAFLVGTVFAGLAVVLQYAIMSIETRDNVIVLFEVGTDQKVIDEFKAKWQMLPQIKEITFTTEEQAFINLFEDTKESNPTINAALSSQKEKKIDSSLDIKLRSLAEIEAVKQVIQQDINVRLSTLEYDPADAPINLLVADKTIERYKEAFLVIRFLMISMLSLLFVIIFFFILMTVEYRTYNRMEEIGVMQLVGGSLAYIRAPYILEGAYYGALGAAISTVTIAVAGYFLIYYDRASAFAELIGDWTRGIELPELDLLSVGLLTLGLITFGALLGALISYVAIRRYIK